MDPVSKKYEITTQSNEQDQLQRNFDHALGQVISTFVDKDKIYNSVFSPSMGSAENKKRIEQKYQSIKKERDDELASRGKEPKELYEKVAQASIYHAVCLKEFSKELDKEGEDLIEDNPCSWGLTKFIDFLFSPVTLLYKGLCHMAGFFSNILGGADAFVPLIIRKLGGFLGCLVALPYKIVALGARLAGCTFHIAKHALAVPLSIVMLVHRALVSIVNCCDIDDERKRSFLFWDPSKIASIIQAKYDLIYLRNGGGAG